MLYNYTELMTSEKNACDRFGCHCVHHVRFPVEKGQVTDEAARGENRQLPAVTSYLHFPFDNHKQPVVRCTVHRDAVTNSELTVH
jgi:hypothetical protein